MENSSDLFTASFDNLSLKSLSIIKLYIPSANAFGSFVGTIIPLTSFYITSLLLPAFVATIGIPEAKASISEIESPSHSEDII